MQQRAGGAGSAAGVGRLPAGVCGAKKPYETEAYQQRPVEPINPQASYLSVGSGRTTRTKRGQTLVLALRAAVHPHF